MTIINYQDYLAWQRAVDLVCEVYKHTKSWPHDELYGLISQVRRAAVSIPSNIAEGQGRRSDRDFARFLRIAHGSLREVETQLVIAQRLGYLTKDQLNVLLLSTSDLGRLITGLLNSIEKPAQTLPA